MAELSVCTPFLCLLPGRLRLPDDWHHTRLIGDVSTLTRRQQSDLYDWLDRGHEEASIISVTSEPLWPLVESGRFLEGLYYRLNVVSVTAGKNPIDLRIGSGIV
jgi:Sigma-54 interaction domain